MWTCGWPRKYQTNDGPSSAPVVPFAVVAEVAVLVKGQAAFLQAALLLEALHYLFLVFFAIGFQEAEQNLLDGGPLVLAGIGDRQAGILGHLVLAAEGNGRLGGPLRQQCDLLLLFVEDFVDLVGQQGLVPEDVAGVMDFLVEPAGGVAVEDRAAEGDVRLAVRRRPGKSGAGRS